MNNWKWLKLKVIRKKVKKVSELKVQKNIKQSGYLDRYDSHLKGPVEPNKYWTKKDYQN